MNQQTEEKTTRNTVLQDFVTNKFNTEKQIHKTVAATVPVSYMICLKQM